MPRRGHWFNPWVRKIPGRREWLPNPICLPEEFHRQRNLAGYSPWGHKESDMLNDRYFHFQIWRDFQDILNFKRKIQHLLAMEETWV